MCSLSTMEYGSSIMRTRNSVNFRLMFLALAMAVVSGCGQADQNNADLAGKRKITGFEVVNVAVQSQSPKTIDEPRSADTVAQSPASNVATSSVSNAVPPLPIKVPAIVEDPNIFLQVNADKSEVYPNEQIILTYDLFTRYDTRYECFAKEGRFRGFWVEFQELKQENAGMTVVEHEGKRFAKATVKKIALFPDAPGKYVIDPGTAKASVRLESNDRENRMLESKPLEITVRDFPSSDIPASFTGFSGSQLKIESSLQTTASASNTINLVLSIKGRGNLWGLKLPSVDLFPGFRLLNMTEETHTNWSGDSIEGNKKFVFSLEPPSFGAMQVPSSSYSYFDLSAKTYQTITTQPLAVETPSRGTNHTAVTSYYADGKPGVVILLDISGSMLAEDLQPGNRLLVTKNALKDFITQNQKARMGLKVFARDVLTIAPLADRSKDLLKNVESIQVGMTGGDGTALGDAILDAVKELRKNKSKKNLIILLSDGSNNMGHLDPMTAADFAKQDHIMIYSIGIGKGGLVPFPVDDPAFGKRYVQAEVNVDHETLSEMASLTDGKSFKAVNGQQLKSALETIAAVLARLQIEALSNQL